MTMIERVPEVERSRVLGPEQYLGLRQNHERAIESGFYRRYKLSLMAAAATYRSATDEKLIEKGLDPALRGPMVDILEGAHRAELPLAVRMESDDNPDSRGALYVKVFSINPLTGDQLFGSEEYVGLWRAGEREPFANPPYQPKDVMLALEMYGNQRGAGSV